MTAPRWHNPSKSMKIKLWIIDKVAYLLGMHVSIDGMQFGKPRPKHSTGD